jgi:hypothetical protein
MVDRDANRRLSGETPSGSIRFCPSGSGFGHGIGFPVLASSRLHPSVTTHRLPGEKKKKEE